MPFNYFAPEHYITSSYQSTVEKVEEYIQEMLEKYPSRQWGTHVQSRSYNEDRTKVRVVIRYFKTKELCHRHCTKPPKNIEDPLAIP
jgi:phenylpyruvate tautomerase PptA (4-oxalocrotonate tautomerase family)